MAAEIFNFAEAAKKRQGESKASSNKKPTKILVTNQDVFHDTFEDVMGEWYRYAEKNQLSHYIESKIPAYAKGIAGDYVNDINLLSEVERKLEIKVVMFYPGCTYNNEYGWLAGFHRGKEVYTTPPDMASEANARALNILLYLAFERHMKSLGRP